MAGFQQQRSLHDKRKFALLDQFGKGDHLLSLRLNPGRQCHRKPDNTASPVKQLAVRMAQLDVYSHDHQLLVILATMVQRHCEENRQPVHDFTRSSRRLNLQKTECERVCYVL